MWVCARAVRVSQVLLEPALFGLASAFRGGGATQAMMVGNASAGVVVVLASVLTRLAAGGGAPSAAQLGVSARLFYALQVGYAVASAAMYLWLLRRSPRLAAAARGQSEAPVRTAECAASPALEREAASTRAAALLLGRRLTRLHTAARACWLPAACQALCFGVTLAAWPSIPGAACVAGGWMAQGWWFTIVVGVYNVLDFGARLRLRRLQAIARRVRPAQCLRLCVARVALVPLIYACAAPGLLAGAGGNVAILLLTAVLAVSNGLLATASMMQVATLAPPGLHEEGVYVAVAGVYFGLASGASFSWVMAHSVMDVGALRCNQTSAG